MAVIEDGAESLVDILTTLDFLELRGKPGRLISLSVEPEHDQMIDLQRSMCLNLCKCWHCKMKLSCILLFGCFSSSEKYRLFLIAHAVAILYKYYFLIMDPNATILTEYIQAWLPGPGSLV